MCDHARLEVEGGVEDVLLRGPARLELGLRYPCTVAVQHVVPKRADPSNAGPRGAGELKLVPEVVGAPCRPVNRAGFWGTARPAERGDHDLQPKFGHSIGLPAPPIGERRTWGQTVRGFATPCKAGPVPIPSVQSAPRVRRFKITWAPPSTSLRQRAWNSRTETVQLVSPTQAFRAADIAPGSSQPRATGSLGHNNNIQQQKPPGLTRPVPRGKQHRVSSGAGRACIHRRTGHGIVT